MEEKKHDKRLVAGLVVGLVTILTLVIGATYAYFSVSTTNSFGTSTINATTETLGNVTLVGTNSTLSLNLSGADMMQGNSDITYWGTTDGTPSITQNIVTLGSTQVTGSGYYSCSYTLNVAATATSAANNLYTAFQGMSGKSTEQIILKIGNNTYDFNTASLFPITVNGTLNGVSSGSIQNITAELYLVNKSNINQNALQGKDITLTVTATNFSCTALNATVAYYTYDGNADWGTYGYATEKASIPSQSWNYYIKETSITAQATEDMYGIKYGEYNTFSDCENLISYDYFSGGACEQVGTKYSFVYDDRILYNSQKCQEMVNDEWGSDYSCIKKYSSGETYPIIESVVCAVFSGTEVCLKPNDQANIDNYYTTMHNLGLVCNDYQNAANLQCSNGSTYNQSGALNCLMNTAGYVYCGISGNNCSMHYDGGVCG